MKRIPKRPKLSDSGDRDILMERTAGLLALRRTGNISKATELAGFLAIFHPELSEERRAKLALEMAKDD